MAGSIGPLVAADEFFNHQIVETHASVLHSDPAWTEKVCGMACARDGSLSVGTTSRSDPWSGGSALPSTFQAKKTCVLPMPAVSSAALNTA